MEFLFYLLVFIVGSTIGSFLNVVVDRSNNGKSFIKGRSQCDHCKHKLGWLDLIPVVSFLLLKGKCRYCKHALSIYYPFVEIITGCSFILVTWSILGPHILLAFIDSRYLLAVLYFFFIISCLIIIFFADLKFGIIPFFVVFPAVLLTFLWYFCLPILHFQPSELPIILLTQHYLLNYLLSALGAFLFFLLLFLFTKGRGMGFGDVIYAFLMGFILGYPNVILSLYIAFLTGAFVSVFLVLLHKKKLKGSTIPFGPFLVLGTIVSLFWGTEIIRYVLSFIS